MTESNYPDWCTGTEKLRVIDGIEDECVGAVIREDIISELGELERERSMIEEKITHLSELLFTLRVR